MWYIKNTDKCTVSSGVAKEAVAYHAFHEEKRDRMMFSIHQLYKKYTPDTVIFAVLMYNLKNTWKDLGLYLLKKGQKVMPQKPQQELYHLHLLLSKLYPKVIDQFPAGHAL